MRMEIPELSVVALIGAGHSGKDAFVQAHFPPAQTLSLAFFRDQVATGENCQAEEEALKTLYAAARKRLDLGLLTVIDAPFADREARAPALRLARDQNCMAVAIVLEFPEEGQQALRGQRFECSVGGAAIRSQTRQPPPSLKTLKQEGFRRAFLLRGWEEAARAEILRVPQRSNQKQVTGPFDIIGDIHGCYDELCALLAKLGYEVQGRACAAAPPQGRKAVFLGDLCDRGLRTFRCCAW